MKKIYSLIKECCNEFMENLDQFAKNKKQINLKLLHSAYTMDVIVKCAFATNTNTYKNANNSFTKNAFAIFNINLLRQILLTIVPNLMIRIESINQLIIWRFERILPQFCQKCD